MDATGLQSGNYLLSYGIVVKIDGRSIFDIWRDAFRGKYKPIPLTGQGLSDLGFVKDKLGDEYYKGDFIIYLPYFFQYKDCVLRKLKYVHQLQNLYFALTSKELTK